MCDLANGQVIVMRPHESASAANVASEVLDLIRERYGAQIQTRLDTILRAPEPPPPAWHSPENRPTYPPPKLPFEVELLSVKTGSELSFADEIQNEYFKRVLNDAAAVAEIVKDPNQRLLASPNWRLDAAVGVPEAVPVPFDIGSNHTSYLQAVGLGTVASNGFDPSFWNGAPRPSAG
jgi:hypothetical protein